jgi:ABC-type polysaccharide/polyol phosphate transport system ATPase subunit
MPSVVADAVGVRFLFDRQGRPVTPAVGRLRRRCVPSWGLRDITLEIRGGEAVALMGGNGAGKTTLLRLLAGVLVPDAGRLEVRGRIGSLLSIDAGLLPRLTGRENAVLLGVLAGLTRADARRNLPAVRDRSGLAAAFDRPVSSYSQGMRARLGFSVIERSDPEILLLDEVHEALDASFREVLVERAAQVTAAGGVVVAAGHDVAELGRLCDRAVVLDSGRLDSDGELAGVLARHD